MSANLKKENMLISWKEIAAYLDCNERTCRRWEKKHGLPIHRFDDSPKSRIFADKEELNDWFNALGNKESVNKVSLALKIPLHKIVSVFFLIIVAALCLYYFFITKAKDSQPTDFNIENSFLVILDGKGKEIWRYDTGIENLINEEKYRNQFQNKKLVIKDDRSYVSLPCLVIKDIDNDGRKEVLFSIQTEDELNEAELFCFDYKGGKRWQFITGGELKYGDITFSSDYRIKGIDTCDLDIDGNFEIIVISSQRYDFPTQLVVLDSEGNEVGEYWNSGRMIDTACVDLNSDGTKEIVVTGMNNEYAKPSLIVFDSRYIKGSSPQQKDFWTCKELEPGSKKYHILLPKVEFSIIDILMEALSQVSVLQNSRLNVMTSTSSIIFEFNYNLELLYIRLTHKFQKKYLQAVQKGKIKEQLNQKKYIKDLQDNILYYDGKNWISYRSMSNPWN